MSRLRVADRRVRRTRQQILDAFRTLVVSAPYDDISVAQLTDRANVGRSTFYENFESKDDVLRQSLAAVLEPLADTVHERYDPERLLAIVRHVRDVRVRAAAMLSGRSRALVCARLADAIRERLESQAVRNGVTPALPLEIVAAQIAGMQIALLQAWLATERDTPAEAIAARLAGSSRALAISCAVRPI